MTRALLFRSNGIGDESEHVRENTETRELVDRSFWDHKSFRTARSPARLSLFVARAGPFPHVSNLEDFAGGSPLRGCENTHLHLGRS